MIKIAWKKKFQKRKNMQLNSQPVKYRRIKLNKKRKQNGPSQLELE